jgi:lysophospholipase L1-like esterase
VLGIIKPNADIETITSPTHLKTGKLTKKDLIIFLGGTNDISRNEAKKGLRSLKDFTQRTINTNLILLGAPHRYDLPPQSCVNTEVTLYNRRLQSFVFVSNHVKVLSMPTKRRHHTRHGLHLNKKGRDWVVNNIIKEIKN